MSEEIITKYAQAAISAAHAVASTDDLLTKYANAALEAKKLRDEQKSAKKEIAKYKVPLRLTYEQVKQVYMQTGLRPARNFYFFIEDEACIQAAYLDEDRKAGSPFGALVIQTVTKLSNPPSWVMEESNRWTLGSVSQITGYSISYIQGFNSGFDGHAPGHRLCSYEFHCGYADGRIIAALLNKAGCLVTDVGDPFREVDDSSDLQELVRVMGYWRAEWGPKPPALLDTTDLTSERLSELGIALQNANI